MGFPGFDSETWESGSVVVRAAQVIAALGADQLAMVAGETVSAVGAHLAVVLDRRGRGGARCLIR